MEALKIIMNKTCLLFPKDHTACGLGQGSPEIIPKIRHERDGR